MLLLIINSCTNKVRIPNTNMILLLRRNYLVPKQFIFSNNNYIHEMQVDRKRNIATIDSSIL